MDEHNVHHFWGISPALDLGSLLPSDADVAVLPVDQPIRILQVAPYDARHTLTTICRASRHPLLQRQQQPRRQVSLMVWEDFPEGLARHVLLIAVLLDGSLLPRERTALLLELHGNTMLRQKAADYLDEKARQLEALIVALSSGGVKGGTAAGSSAASAAATAAVAAAGAAAGGGKDGGGSSVAATQGTEAEALALAESRGLVALARMLDLSLLKFQEKDLIVEALQKWRTTVSYDMVKAWDARARKWYGDRYDFRRNMVDWDYHMRLQAAGTPGQDPAHGSIIHFHHFRHWRMHGVAHELRDSHYNQPNRSLLSTAYGRTREFKDRSLRDVGRSVSAWGFWADALNGPYHCFGTLTEDAAFYRVTNRQFARTAVDVAEHNVTALLHELRTGEQLILAQGCEAPRAKVARGPTSLEDLTAAAASQQGKGQGQGSEQEQDQGLGEGKQEPGQQDQQHLEQEQGERKQREGGKEGVAATGGGQQRREAEQQQGQGPSQCAEAYGPAGPSASDGAAVSALQSTPCSGRPDVGSEPSSGPNSQLMPPAPSATSPQAATDASGAASAPAPSTEAVPAYSSGGRAQVAKAIAAATATSAPQVDGAAVASSTAAAGVLAAADNGRGDGVEAALRQNHEEAARQRMAAEEAALRAEEARLDAAGRERAARLFRLQLVTGDLVKGVTGRAKYADAFAVLTLGHRHVHMLAEEFGLLRVSCPGATLVAENGRHVLQLNKEQAAMFVSKMDEMATAAGWVKAPSRPSGATEASEVYLKPRAP